MPLSLKPNGQTPIYDFWLLDEQCHQPIVQQAVLLNDAPAASFLSVFTIQAS